MKFEAEGDLKLQLDLFLNHGLNLFDNFELPVELGIDTELNRVAYTWPDSNPSDQGILSNDGDGTLSWAERASNALDVFDVLISLGLWKTGGPLGYYGGIFASDAGDELTISSSGQANKIQVTTFDTNAHSDGVTSIHESNHLLIVHTGIYFCICSMAVESIDGAGATFGFAAYKNNGVTEFENIHAHRDLAAGGGDVGSVTMHGHLSLVAGDTVEIWVWNEDNTSNIVVDDITLCLHRIGL
ncbi:hypothetical protein LCGC14_1899570 [marine sediment metagenome]|uniref:Uncharacterized protein n=1 Tax=marine sediment metagenome TaxID=412755 RepID=A0A0F9IAX2_9ZZZZ